MKMAIISCCKKCIMGDDFETDNTDNNFTSNCSSLQKKVSLILPQPFLHDFNDMLNTKN